LKQTTQMFLKRFLFALIGVLSCLGVKAQDPEFSQFYAAPLYLNPAFAGTAGGPRFILNYRNQWPGINNAYEHFAFSYDQNIPALAGGIGLLVTNDNQADGIFKTTHVSGMYSYQLKMSNKVFMKAAIATTYANHSVNTNGLVWGYRAGGLADEQAVELNGTYNTSFIDFGTGALLFSEKFFAGISVDHLIEPNQSLNGGNSPLYRKYTAHVGTFIPVGKRQSNASISPNILYQQQASFSQINLGMYYNRGPIVIGGWYRTSLENGDAFIVLAGVKYNIYKIGYSYDIVTSRLRASASGAHEISLAIEFASPDRRSRGRSFKRINCPSF
jgi:type IX secretion system PorP/SprF family membrane protein